MAKTLLEKGDVYGKQFVVFESYQAYPMYVVTYTCPDDFTPQLTATRTQVADVVVEGHVLLIQTIYQSSCPPQRPMKWEHKTKSEKSWTVYSPEHTMRLSQAIMLTSFCDTFLLLK